MSEIYVIAKFKLQENSEEKRMEWKKLSDFISADMSENAEGLIFRDSVTDKDGNVQCILKWESLEKQQIFHEKFQEMIKENSEIMENFGKIADISTMSKDTFDLV